MSWCTRSAGPRQKPSPDTIALVSVFRREDVLELVLHIVGVLDDGLAGVIQFTTTSRSISSSRACASMDCLLRFRETA